MSLVSDLRELVINAEALVAEMPATTQRRRLEQAFDTVEVALGRLTDESTIENVKDAVAEEFEKATPEEDLVSLRSATPFSE